jgi:hypothetical protein
MAINAIECQSTIQSSLAVIDPAALHVGAGRVGERHC